MKRTLAILALLWLSPAWAEDESIVVRAGAPRVNGKAIQVGQPLPLGVRIISEREPVVLALTGGTALRMAPDSELQAESGGRVTLWSGQLLTQGEAQVSVPSCQATAEAVESCSFKLENELVRVTPIRGAVRVNGSNLRTVFGYRRGEAWLKIPAGWWVEAARPGLLSPPMAGLVTEVRSDGFTLSDWQGSVSFKSAHPPMLRALVEVVAEGTRAKSAAELGPLAIAPPLALLGLLGGVNLLIDAP